MNSIVSNLIVFGCVFGAGLAGLSIRAGLPRHHLNEESKEVIKISAGLVATLTALVLGLMISSAKDSFDSVNLGMTESSAKMIRLDRILSKYGPDAAKAREQLRESMAHVLGMFWSEKRADKPLLASFEKFSGVEQVEDTIRALVPQTDPQHLLQAQAIQLCEDVLQTRWLLIERAQVALPKVFWFILVCWLVILFACFGLLSARNGTVIGMFFVCAVSVAGAMFLIEEMNSPLGGLMKISSAPLQKALEMIGK